MAVTDSSTKKKLKHVKVYDRFRVGFTLLDRSFLLKPYLLNRWASAA